MKVKGETEVGVETPDEALHLPSYRSCTEGYHSWIDCQTHPSIQLLGKLKPDSPSIFLPRPLSAVPLVNQVLLPVVGVNLKCILPWCRMEIANYKV